MPRTSCAWLVGQPGYKSFLRYGDADYFNLAETEVRIAKAVRQKAFLSLEQVYHTQSVMPCATDIEKRNRALASFRLKHVDLQEGRVDQDARDV